MPVYYDCYYDEDPVRQQTSYVEHIALLAYMLFQQFRERFLKHMSSPAFLHSTLDVWKSWLVESFNTLGTDEIQTETFASFFLRFEKYFKCMMMHIVILLLQVLLNLIFVLSMCLFITHILN